MKIVLRLVFGLVLGAPVGFAGDDVSKVPFVLGPTHVKDGDAIVIEQVLATSPNLTVGDKVVVRGRYDLRSEDNAQLCLFLTCKECFGEPDSGIQRKEVKKGSGEFELSEVVRHSGYLHVSFYRILSGKRFGTVYFGTERQMKECSYKNALD